MRRAAWYLIVVVLFSWFSDTAFSQGGPSYLIIRDEEPLLSGGLYQVDFGYGTDDELVLTSDLPFEDWSPTCSAEDMSLTVICPSGGGYTATFFAQVSGDIFNAFSLYERSSQGLEFITDAAFPVVEGGKVTPYRVSIYDRFENDVTLQADIINVTDAEFVGDIEMIVKRTGGNYEEIFFFEQVEIAPGEHQQIAQVVSLPESGNYNVSVRIGPETFLPIGGESVPAFAYTYVPVMYNE